MYVAYVVVTVLTILANAGIATADFARAQFVLDNAAQVGPPERLIPLAAALKAAGAAGLLLGLLGVRFLGIAAAIGLVLFFICALAAHVRASVYYNIAFPLAYFALAVGSLVLAIEH